MTVDDNDNIWVAFWGGGAVRGFDPAGTLIAEITVPTARVTSCAFGGEALDRLFITSAVGVDSPHAPPAGGVFVADTVSYGQRPHAFNG
jgi:xylono-1,5-lactonase